MGVAAGPTVFAVVIAVLVVVRGTPRPPQE
jgi:hypothetical protein